MHLVTFIIAEVLSIVDVEFRLGDNPLMSGSGRLNAKETLRRPHLTFDLGNGILVTRGA